MPSSIPAIENLSSATKYVIAFAIIFILLALFALVLRRLTGGRTGMSNERGRGRQPRLGVVDVYDLDRQRQLILLRRDNVEHLLLVGGPNDVVVETNIVRVAGARLPAAAADFIDRPETERAIEAPSVRPVVEPSARPEQVAAHLGNLETAVANAALQQVVSASRAPEPMLKPTEVTPRVTAEPVRPARAAPAPEVRTPPRPVTTPVAPRPTAAAPSPAPANASPAREPAGNPATLSTMARQLEDALRREPAAAPARVTPPRRPEPETRPETPPAPPVQDTKAQEARAQEDRAQQARDQEARAQEARAQEARAQEARAQEARAQSARTGGPGAGSPCPGSPGARSARTGGSCAG